MSVMPPLKNGEHYTVPRESIARNFSNVIEFLVIKKICIYGNNFLTQKLFQIFSAVKLV